MKHTGYRVLSTTDFNKIERIVVKYNNEEYQLSAKKTEQFIKAVKNLIKDKTSSTITILQHWLTHQMGMCIILKQG